MSTKTGRMAFVVLIVAGGFAATFASIAAWGMMLWTGKRLVGQPGHLARDVVHLAGGLLIPAVLAGVAALIVLYRVEWR
jgi:hypothetical protein